MSAFTYTFTGNPVSKGLFGTYNFIYANTPDGGYYGFDNKHRKFSSSAFIGGLGDALCELSQII